ncbi:putative addiction module antidote protein [Rothia terrae]|uniref:addiction module antidote protein n=1 Tax=Rothia terrae TaxID=396015 RepID=UPI001447C6BE|nr:addiction module antidote protein [Rothia terrae]NKZ33911.1 putative addiction module antidote protein [Rothia terrae]
MNTKLSPRDAAEHLESREQIIAYLNAALETGESAVLQAALGDIARSQGMATIAEKVGVGRESLYKSLSTEGNPSWKTVLKIFNALDLQLEVSEKAAA